MSEDDDTQRPGRDDRDGRDHRRPRRDGAAGGTGRPSSGAGRRSSGAGRSGGTGRPSGDRTGKPSGGRPERGGRPDRPGARQTNGGAPRTGGARDGGGRDAARRAGGNSERGASAGREGRNDTWGRRDSELTPEQKRARTMKRVRERHEDPFIDADVTPEMLIKSAYNDLKTLDKENADVVARHLVMVARLLDENPEKAHMHAISASRRGGRIGLTRETLGITAYTIGDFSLALRELKTYQRITGRDDQIALMVDAERGVGRPDKALELGRSVDRTKLEDSVQVNLAIALSGARLDKDQVDLALAELEIPQLRAEKAYAYHVPLYYAYADVLAELGRDEEAAKWSRRAELLDEALDRMETAGGTDESMHVETEYEADEGTA